MTEISVWRRRVLATAFVLALSLAWAMGVTAPALPLWLVQTQDLPVLLLLLAAMVLVAWWRPQWSLPDRWPATWVLVAAGALTAALLAWGTYALLGNFPLSRDEHMVLFDMAIYDKGRLAMPLAPEWRAYARALVPEFLLNNNNPSGLVSGYLPMNALLRLAFSNVGDPAWFNPLLVVVGGAALLDVARREFGPNRRACVVVLLVYLLSAQMLALAMTTYSMTGHMTLNLVWLAAFLRGGKTGNAVAIVTGFIAVGFHQVAFHPFFVAPFLLWKLRDGEWKTVLLYAVAYGAIILWWAYYPLLVSPDITAPGARASDDDFLRERVLPLLLKHDPGTLGLMILNLLRFVAWQNLALLPLVIAAIPATRERGLARALLFGILLWIAFVGFVLPIQGRGWGYRYLSPYLGSFALLAGFGYRQLHQWVGRQADGLVIVTSGLTLAVAIPQQLSAAHRLMGPHLALQQLIEAQRTPFVLIDDEGSTTVDGRFGENATDHVRNLPDLSNRPLRLGTRHLNLPEILELCRRGTVTLITHRDMHEVGFGPNVPERSERYDALVAAASRQKPGCFRSPAFARVPAR